MLVKLIHDLVHDPAVAEDFQADPHEVLDRYRVSPDERQLIVEGGPHAVSLAAMNEFVGTLGNLHSGPTPMMWQPQMPKVRDAVPSEVRAGSVSKVNVEGDYFPILENIVVQFQRGTTTIDATVSKVTNAQEKRSEAMIEVRFPEGAGGDYTLVLGDKRVTSTVKWYPFMVQ